MASQTPSKIYQKIPLGGTGSGVYSAVVSILDTVTLSDFNTILQVLVINLATNALVTATTATNVVTITGAITAEKILIFAFGT